MIVPSSFELVSCIADISQAPAVYDAGADAIYAGVKGYSARHPSVDIVWDDFVFIAKLAQDRGKKLYATFNQPLDDQGVDFFCTICSQNERSPVVDAFIVSDLGAIYEASRLSLINTSIHASINTGLLNEFDIKWAADNRVSRIILSTNISFSFIASLTSRFPYVDFEMLAYGGVCFFDAARCPCFYSKEDITVGTICSYNYKNSMSHETVCFQRPHLDGSCVADYIHIGIKKFKIEGRSKGLDYILEGTRSVRNRIDKRRLIWSVL